VQDASAAAARLAEPGEGISAEELRLAARNHAMPLEALRYDVTPAGLHYLLIHFDIPHLDETGHTLAIDGHVRRPLKFGLAQLRDRPSQTHRVTLECAGNGRALLEPRPVSQPWLSEAVGTAEWTGTSLAALLDEAGVERGAVDVVFTGADHGIERGVEQDYQRGLPLAEALREDVIVAYEMNGQPLPPQHGAPLRLIVPGWYGMAHVKWLTGVTVLDREFDGFQNAVAYRLRRDAADEGVPVTRIEPRALVCPPGFPDFMSRTRVVKTGVSIVEGRAWSGFGPVAAVEVTTDGGQTWHPAQLGAQAGPYAWRGWSWRWEAAPGRYVLGARAADATGRTQPVEAEWNRGGFANNGVQQVDVVVVD
jgi:DMSO/TMAO reductase YedYZ molybdopterin-dependent catalytic subunit